MRDDITQNCIFIEEIVFVGGIKGRNLIFRLWFVIGDAGDADVFAENWICCAAFESR